MPFAEEPWLREGLGTAYEDYCTRVPRFIPSFARRRETDAVQASRVERNRQLVADFWHAVYEERDEARIGSFFNEDGRYEDAVLPETAGVGPKDAAHRLAIGHARIESFDHEVHRMVAEGDTVFTEHTATWHFHTGEVIPLPFVSIHVVRAGKFDLWRDYWDLGSWVAAAPQWWIEHIATDGENR
jgi:limonene-1,2-epoxide hydrolase